MYWDEANECMDRERLRAVQTERLIKTVERAYNNVPHYRSKLKKAGVKPSDIRDIDDIKKLPFTTKDDLRENYPYGMFAVPLSDIVRIHASSGTTGKPTVVGYTHYDLDVWGDVMARTMTMAGGSRKSVIQVAFGYGLFTGGLGAHMGAERIGASVIPISGGNSHKQVMIMKDFGTTLLACTPSYALHLSEVIQEMGIDKSELKLKTGVFGAEPWTEGMRKRIEEGLGIRATDIYGLSEITGPGVASECEYQDGMHINEDHFYPELIDPVTLEHVPDGEEGELVFTTISKEGIPVLRYRTHDITRLNREKCKCGRTLVRMEKVMGRSDDMLIIRGVNVFPSQIEEILTSISEIEPHYLIIVDRVNNLDTLELQVEMSPELFSDEVRQVEAVSCAIQNRIHSTLGLGVKLKLVEPKTIDRSEGKAKRVIDKRNIRE
ncbi:MAG: phenylacetate--CoA ligase family protein [Christensenellales bacterium]|jgi:phenylacetate-CoA ligase